MVHFSIPVAQLLSTEIFASFIAQSPISDQNTAKRVDKGKAKKTVHLLSMEEETFIQPASSKAHIINLEEESAVSTHHTPTYIQSTLY